MMNTSQRIRLYHQMREAYEKAVLSAFGFSVNLANDPESVPPKVPDETHLAVFEEMYEEALALEAAAYEVGVKTGREALAQEMRSILMIGEEEK